MISSVLFYPKKGVSLYSKGRISIFKMGVSHSLKGRGPKKFSGGLAPGPPSILTPPLRDGWRRRCRKTIKAQGNQESRCSYYTEWTLGAAHKSILSRETSNGRLGGGRGRGTGRFQKFCFIDISPENFLQEHILSVFVEHGHGKHVADDFIST